MVFADGQGKHGRPVHAEGKRTNRLPSHSPSQLLIDDHRQSQRTHLQLFSFYTATVEPSGKFLCPLWQPRKGPDA